MQDDKTPIQPEAGTADAGLVPPFWRRVLHRAATVHRARSGAVRSVEDDHFKRFLGIGLRTGIGTFAQRCQGQGAEGVVLPATLSDSAVEGITQLLQLESAQRKRDFLILYTPPPSTPKVMTGILLRLLGAALSEIVATPDTPRSAELPACTARRGPVAVRAGVRVKDNALLPMQVVLSPESRESESRDVLRAAASFTIAEMPKGAARYAPMIDGALVLTAWAEMNKGGRPKTVTSPHEVKEVMIKHGLDEAAARALLEQQAPKKKRRRTRAQIHADKLREAKALLENDAVQDPRDFIALDALAFVEGEARPAPEPVERVHAEPSLPEVWNVEGYVDDNGDFVLEKKVSQVSEDELTSGRDK